jgi:hypothetical protein
MKATGETGGCGSLAGSLCSQETEMAFGPAIPAPSLTKWQAATCISGPTPSQLSLWGQTELARQS